MLGDWRKGALKSFWCMTRSACCRQVSARCTDLELGAECCSGAGGLAALAHLQMRGAQDPVGDLTAGTVTATAAVAAGVRGEPAGQAP
jgi:hypothetical protein